MDRVTSAIMALTGVQANLSLEEHVLLVAQGDVLNVGRAVRHGRRATQ